MAAPTMLDSEVQLHISGELMNMVLAYDLCTVSTFTRLSVLAGQCCSQMRFRHRRSAQGVFRFQCCQLNHLLHTYEGHGQHPRLQVTSTEAGDIGIWCEETQSHYPLLDIHWLNDQERSDAAGIHWVVHAVLNLRLCVAVGMHQLALDHITLSARERALGVDEAITHDASDDENDGEDDSIPLVPTTSPSSSIAATAATSTTAAGMSSTLAIDPAAEEPESPPHFSSPVTQYFSDSDDPVFGEDD